MKTTLRFLLAPTAIAAALPLFCAPVLAGRPLQTDDAGVLERGACEIEAYAGRLSVSSEIGRERSLQFGCGVGLSTQLALAAGTTRAGADRSRSWTLAGKTGLWQAATADEAAPRWPCRMVWRGTAAPAPPGGTRPARWP